MTNEEREALIVWARERNAEMNAEETRALLSALDEARAEEARARLGYDTVTAALEGGVGDPLAHALRRAEAAERERDDMRTTMLAMRSQRDAYADERDEARGQLAALHAAASPFVRTRIASDYEVRFLRITLANTDAATQEFVAEVRAPIERERDAAIARADAAETTLSNLRALRLGDQLDEMRAERNKAREERDTMSAALAEIARLRAAYLDAQRWALDAENMRVALSRKYGRRPYLFADYVAAKERSAALGLAAAEAEVAYEAALATLPVDLAAQRDARMVRRGIERAIERWRIDTATDDEIGALADEAEKGGA